MLHHIVIHKKCEDMNFLCLYTAGAEEAMQERPFLHTNPCDIAE
jgi:hypothetical protein